MIRVAVVDDHTMVRLGLERMLSLIDDIVVVAAAGSSEQALRIVAEHAPDVVLMDIAMPGIDGIDTTGAIKSLHPATKVIMLSTFDDAHHVGAAFDVGAEGYLLKDTEPEALVAGIRAVMTGGVPLSPTVAARVINAGLHRSEPRIKLSRREADVIWLIVDGYSNKQIGKALGISDKTVKTHCARLFRRLGVHDRTQAAIWAERHLARAAA